MESQMQKTNLSLPEGKRGRVKLGGWDGHVHIMIYKIGTNKDLLYSIETVLNTLYRPTWAKNLQKSGYMYVYN